MRRSTSACATPNSLYPSPVYQTFHAAATGALTTASCTNAEKSLGNAAGVRQPCVPENVRNRSFALHFILLLAVCSAFGRAPDRENRVSTEICKLEADFDHAIIARDDKFLTELLADEYQHTNFLGGVTDKHAELSFLLSTEFKLKKASIDSCKVRIYGKHVAVATGINNWVEASYRGQNLSGRYRFTTVYVYRDHRWQLAVGHDSIE